ncbi:MAG: transporter [Tatlockia sp.]|nr:transporter [Tatlockia sp.]
MKRSGFISCFLGVFCILGSTLAYAYDQPVVNLGYTSFLDGGPPAGPGFYFQNYYQYYYSDRFNDDKGDRLPFPLTKLRVNADILQLIYLSTKRILGASLGVSAVLPTVLSASVDDGLPQSVLKATTGIGDLTIGPALQFDPIMRKDGKTPLFVQRFELDTIVPIGHYDSNFAIMPSANFWSITPYWAATLWMTPKWAFSTRIHYLWNAKNRDPNISFGTKISSTQAGQAFYGNFATDYAITEQFHLGINGYLFNQFTNTKVNGVGVTGRQEKIWAIGPGILYGLTKNQFLFFNLYFEQGARNRTQGTNAILRYALHFG